MHLAPPAPLSTNAGNESPFAQICSALLNHGFFVQKNFFTHDLIDALYHEVCTHKDLHNAGIGKGESFQINQTIRKDEIRWLNGDSPAQREYLQHMEVLRHMLNEQLMLALFEYECHFAHYSPGAYYKKHFDGFQNTRSRLVTTVSYLNPQWSPFLGGELRLYDPKQNEQILCDIAPEGGTLAVFLSEEVPHEVLPTKHDRYSIAGWFRLRTLNQR